MPIRFLSWMPLSALVIGIVLTATDVSGAPPNLSEALASRFDIGTAISADQLSPPKQELLSFVTQQFSVVTAENAMKWEVIHPQPGQYDFTAADALVDFAEANNLKVVGHTLVWHSQCPEWVFQDGQGKEASREVLVQRMRDHIHKVAGRYKGRITGWDVVNEAFLDDGAWRKSPWYRIIGDDFIELAFRFAHEADPTAELYYNDYSMTKPGKRKATQRLVHDLKSKGIPIHGVGLQGHWGFDYPSDQEIDDALTDYAALRLQVMITELDINFLPRPSGAQGADITERAELRDELDPYRDGLPDEIQQELAHRYGQLFRFFDKHSDAISRVTLWGVHDGQSWHNNWPVPGRTAHSLIFDRQLQPKAAFWAILPDDKKP